MDFLEALQNQQKSQIFKKTMYEFLKERYGKNEMILDRISHALVTDNDLHQFMTLITDVCEMGYLRAINDHKEQLNKLGISVKIV